MSEYRCSIGGAVYRFNNKTLELDYCYNKVLVAKGMEKIKYKFALDALDETEKKQ